MELERPTRAKPGLLFLLGGLTAFGPMSVDMYLPALPAIGESLGAGPGQVESSMAAFLAGMAIGQLCYGSASDRFGRRPMVLIGLGVYVAASILCALAQTFEALLIGRFIQALGASAGGVISRAVIRDRFDHARTAQMLSLMMLVTGLAPILAPLVGGGVLTLFGWRWIFGCLSLFGLIMAVSAYLHLSESRSEETAAMARSASLAKTYSALLGNRRLAGYLLGGALNGAMLFTYISASPELLIGFYRIPAAQFGWVFSINAIGLIGGGFLNRRLLRSHSPDRILAVSSWAAVLITAILVAAAMTGAGGRAGALVLLFLILSTYGFLQGNTLAGALNVDPLRAGSTAALFGASSMAAGAIASQIAAFLHDGTPKPMAFAMLAASIGAAVSLRTLTASPGSRS